MERTWRWFGRNDSITLDQLKQIGVEGIVTALHDVPLGEVWTQEKIHVQKAFIESYGLKWSVVESLPVVETLKYGGPDRDRQVEVYKESLRNLGKEDIHCVCYNFMPVLDWARTDLLHRNPNGSYNLYMDWGVFAYFDIYLLKREGAREDWNGFSKRHSNWGRDLVSEADRMAEEATPESDHELVVTIVNKTQGFLPSNFGENDEHPLELFRELLKNYDGLGRKELQQNLKYWMEAIMPVCDEYDINMCVHPDDPPYPIFGLPRIIGSDEDIQWLMDAVPNPHNGLTFCAGSLSAGEHNDVTGMARKFADRTHFVHLRSCHIFPNGNFTEASHLGGRADIVELCRIFEQAERRGKCNSGHRLPMRIDHGMTMLGDEEKGYNAGYSFLGRMFALGQVQGIMAAVDNELGIEYRQPGFFD